MQITSHKNPALQELRRTIRTGRPSGGGVIAIEGPHLLEEAVDSGLPIQRVFVTSAARERYAEVLTHVDAELTEVTERALAAAAETETNQGIVALVRPRTWTWPDLLKDPAMLVILDGIQDPGNAGTIIRSAEAFGATGAVLTAESVRAANGKFLRASAGSLFRIPFLEGLDPADLARRISSSSLALFALAASGGDEITNANFGQPCALVVGNEGSGISPELLRAARVLRIPVRKVESLNAGVACSIALFEAYRQRGSL